MRIFITGGTGFIGTALCQKLAADGHQLTVLSRKPQRNTQAVEFCQDLANFPNFDDFDAVINLAGEPIFDKRWTTTQKARLRQSRLELTYALSGRIAAGQNPPHTFISGSASGFYGDLPVVNFYDEQTACGTNFAAQLCADWETAALTAESPQTRVCLLRTGIVLATNGGALARMLPLYRLGLGGKLGSGKQYWSWIALADHIRAICFLLENPHCAGAFNLVAPNPLPNAEFNRLLGKTLSRPTVFGVPAALLKLLLGERSQILLDNQPLVPQKLLTAGFRFTEPELAPYLSKIL